MVRYEVIWDDAHGDTAMFTAAEMDHKPYRFNTIGYLVKTDDIGVSLAHDVGEDGHFRDHVFIPRAMIVSEHATDTKKPRKPRKPKELKETEAQ